MRPEYRAPRLGATGVRWEHDGVDVDTWLMTVDGVDYDLGVLSPVSGTTYEANLPGGLSAGTHDVYIYAINEFGATASAELTVTV